MELRSIEGVEVEGKRVLLRCDLNLPVSGGRVADEFRLVRALKTIEYLADRGAKLIVVSHFGRDGESLEPVADALVKKLSARTVRFSSVPFQEAGAETAALGNGEILILENLRREPGEETNDPAFAQTLASLADLYVDDAFGVAHRAHASIVGVPKLLPSYAGLLMMEEVARLSEALTPPQGAVAIIGGAKFETKEPVIKKLLEAGYAKVLVAGAIANDFMKAKGLGVGISLISDAPVPQVLVADPRILVQTDVVVSDGHSPRDAAASDVHPDERIVDAGSETSNAWSGEITRAPFVLWNGPLGIYELGFTAATNALAQALVASSARAAVGGGDTLAALAQEQFDESRIFRSTGGGAMLEFLTAGTLPGLEPLVK